jgi:hypothetical protein
MKKKPMYRFLIALGFALVLFTPGLAQAQAGATPTPVAPNQRPTIPSIRLPLSRPAQETVAVTTTVTESAVISATALVTDVLAPAAAATPDPYANILEGTIIANRTELPVRFFVEGQTYDLAPLRSLGLALPRESAVLNLFNCAASRDSTDPACFWDPYLLTLDGFYEVIDGAVAGRTVDVALREAGEPDSNQIWVQNRLGAVESIVVGDEVVELAPSSVREFVVGSDGPVIVQLRECIELGGQSVCEWTPRGVDAGFYYGLVRKESPGPNGAQLVRVELERVLAPATASDAGAPITEGACRLLVPTLNVRSGPGLEFSILTKVRSTTEAPASITVIGFDPTRQWMQVEPTVAAGGWVIANPDYIVCSGDLAQLPIILPPVVEAPPTPTPEPAPTPRTGDRGRASGCARGGRGSARAGGGRSAGGRSADRNGYRSSRRTDRRADPARSGAPGRQQWVRPGHSLHDGAAVPRRHSQPRRRVGSGAKSIDHASGLSGHGVFLCQHALARSGRQRRLFHQ